MITLRTLGECAIEVGAQRVGPAAPQVFALLLYLAMERGRRVPRATLQALLFPEAPESNASHCLRQLLYRLRQLGVPVETGAEGVSIAAESVTDDYSVLFVPAADCRAEVQRAAGGFLPGYLPRWSEPYARWVEEQRDVIHARVRRTLLVELAEHRRAARWEAAERTARSCLAIDPLNEDATLGLAETLAVSGSKVQAVRLLDQYIAEAGPGAEAVKLPATLLRRRIAERLPAMEYDASRAPFVGRAEEMAALQALLTQVRRGESATAVVWGEAGIGKTRLVAEFCKGAVLGGATVLRSVSQPHDIRRPMGAFLDLAPSLLKLPGALGTSPESMRYLQRLVSFDPQLDQPLTPEMKDPEYLAACITRALSELLDAVSAEAPLVLIVEDAQWLDRVSKLVLGDLVSERKSRRVLLLCTWRATEDPTPETPYPERVRSIRIRGLSDVDAARLAATHLQAFGVATQAHVTEWSVSTAQGNPFFLHEIARHYAVHREVGDVPSSLLDLLRARIAQVDQNCRMALSSCAVLGSMATVRRLERMLEMSRQEFHRTLMTLEHNGLLRCDRTRLSTAHPLIAELALRDTTQGVRHLLHKHAAEILGDEVANGTLAIAAALAEHLSQAGDVPMALSKLDSCATQLEVIGHFDAAAVLLERASILGTDTSQCTDRALRAMRLSEVTGELTQTIRIANHILAVAGNRVTESTRGELHLALLQARWRVAECPRQIAVDLKALEAMSLSTETARQAAFLAIAVYEFSYNDQFARTASVLIRALDQQEDDESKLVRLAYHISIGDPRLAGELCQNLIPRYQARLSNPQLLRTALRLAHAVQRLGDSVLAEQLQCHVHEESLRIGMPYCAFYAASEAAVSAVYCGDESLAGRWHAIADESLSHNRFAQNFATHYLTSAILALRAGNYEHALVAWQRLGNASANYRFVEYHHRALGALLESLGCHATNYSHQEQMQFLEPVLGKEKLDLSVEFLAAALRLRGNATAAASLVRRHLASRRDVGRFTLVLPAFR